MDEEIKKILPLFFKNLPHVVQSFDTGHGDADFRTACIVETDTGEKYVLKLAENDFTFPEKIAVWPKYEYFRANKDYAEIARYVGIQGKNDDELIEGLVQRIIKLAHEVGVTLSLKAWGVDKAKFDAAVDRLAVLA